MVRNKEQPMATPPDPSAYDGSLHWPTINGSITRVNPFHIAAYGLCKGMDGDKKGWVVWVNLGGGMQLQTFHESEETAKQDFKRIQLAKTIH